jgi:hypothetical protein
MIKRKAALVISMSLMLTCALSNVCYASTESKAEIISSSTDIKMNNDLSTKDLSKIKENINKFLSSKYEIMKNETSTSNSFVLNDSKLHELTEVTNDFEKKWYKKVNLKISDYNSTLKINDIKKTSNNTYVANVTYDVEFTLLGHTDKSGSRGEKYELELKNVNNNWCISKLIDMQEDEPSVNSNTSKVLSTSMISSSNNDFEKYDGTINTKIENMNNNIKNIDSYLKEYNDVKNSNNIKNSLMLKSSYSGYNADDAVDYALRWAYGKNSDYNDYDDNDCTNFVSQCAYEGGGIPGSSQWYSKSPAWINVGKFYTYMTNNGYADGGSSSGSRLGDVIQLYNSNANKKTWSHSVIITGSDSSGWLYSGHSQPRRNYPLASVYPSSTYTDIRYIKFWH